MNSRDYFYGILSKDEQEKVTELYTITELIENGVNLYPDNVAIAGSHGETTYKNLENDLGYVRSFLDSLELKSNSHIGLLFPNNYSFIKGFLGATTAGHVAVPFPMTMDGKSISAGLLKMEVEVLFYGNESASLIEGVKEIYNEIKFINVEEIPSTKYKEATKVDKNLPAAIMFTGGTTGLPKGALLSHKALMQGAFNGIFATHNVFEIRYYALIPLTHIFGLVRSFLTALYTGSCVYLCENMKNIFIDLPKAKPDAMALVPALANMIYGIIMTKGIEAVGGNLKVIICGGASVSPGIIRKFNTLGIDILPGYGLTETANLVSGNGYSMEYPESVGMPYFCQELKIVDGELWIKGDNLMIEYFNDPEETSKVMEDGWFKTGDLVKMDEEGLLYIVGRTKNIIILDNGENVSPEELEALFYNIPVVQDCLVYEDKNQFGEGIIAIEILPNMKAFEDAEIIDINYSFEEILNDINASLPTFKQIKKLVIKQEDFERSPSMKIKRK